MRLNLHDKFVDRERDCQGSRVLNIKMRSMSILGALFLLFCCHYEGMAVETDTLNIPQTIRQNKYWKHIKHIISENKTITKNISNYNYALCKQSTDSLKSAGFPEDAIASFKSLFQQNIDIMLYEKAMQLYDLHSSPTTAVKSADSKTVLLNLRKWMFSMDGKNAISQCRQKSLKGELNTFSSEMSISTIDDEQALAEYILDRIDTLVHERYMGLRKFVKIEILKDGSIANYGIVRTENWTAADIRFQHLNAFNTDTSGIVKKMDWNGDTYVEVHYYKPYDIHTQKIDSAINEIILNLEGWNPIISADGITVDTTLTVELTFGGRICNLPDVMPKYKGGKQALEAYIAQSPHFVQIQEELKNAAFDTPEIVALVLLEIDRNGRIKIFKEFKSPLPTKNPKELMRGNFEPIVLASTSDTITYNAYHIACNMPLWIPGFKDGIPVRTKYILPIGIKRQGGSLLPHIPIDTPYKSLTVISEYNENTKTYTVDYTPYTSFFNPIPKFLKEEIRLIEKYRIIPNKKYRKIPNKIE